MIEVILAIKEEDLKEVFLNKFKNYEELLEEEFEFIYIEKIKKYLENNNGLLIYEIDNLEDLKKVEIIKENYKNLDLIFVSKKSELVFNAVLLQPIQFIRVANLKEDLIIMNSVLENYVQDKHKSIMIKDKEFSIKLKIKNIIYRIFWTLFNDSL